MEKQLLGSKIFCFNPSLEKESKVRNKTVYHYTSPDGLLSILNAPSIRFTDCQFLNDKSEYNHIHFPLETAFEEVRETVFDADLCSLIQEYINDKYDYSELVSENPDLGFKGLRMYNFRHYVFCASTDSDSLNMWNYYVKGGNYQGYNIGISVRDILTSLSAITDRRIKIFYGQIIYSDKEKAEILKKTIVEVDEKLHTALLTIHDQEEREIAIQEHYGELISYIENYRLFFKDAAFSSEKEYRFVIRIPTLHKEIQTDILKPGYSIKQGVFTPYCDVSFPQESVIKKITLAPMMEDVLAKAGLKRYLCDNGYSNQIEIDKSKVPIRF